MARSRDAAGPVSASSPPVLCRLPRSRQVHSSSGQVLSMQGQRRKYQKRKHSKLPLCLYGLLINPTQCPMPTRTGNELSYSEKATCVFQAQAQLVSYAFIKKFSKQFFLSFIKQKKTCFTCFSQKQAKVVPLLIYSGNFENEIKSSHK
jgi:hypothetical protein